MTIRFLPNDPFTQDVLPVRDQPPRQDPPAAEAGFSYAGAIPEDLYAVGSPEFLFWQCREAALATLDAWRTLAAPPASWQNGQRLLPLQHDAGQGLNAHYDRATVSFLGTDAAGRRTHTAASTDAVAHEVGHALLDAMRPELWDSVFTEPAAFHEAFADCMALLVSLSDGPSRQAVLQGAPPPLRTMNFVESLAEDIAEGVRLEAGPGHPQALPRHALNTFKWEIPINLPPLGPPARLTSEPHSFGRVFTGCFYDTVCNIFALQPNQDEQGLLAAARIAGRLLIAAARDAPEVARFFQALGRAMILADEAENGAAHHAAIRDGFAGHDVAIGSSVMLAPTAALAGGAPTVHRRAGRAPTVHRRAGGALLSAGARRDLLGRIRAPGGRLSVRPLELGGRVVAHAVHQRRVSLGKLDRRLKGAVASAAESVLVGASAARAVVLGHLPDPGTTVDEVQHFVGTLLEHGAVAFASARTTGARRTRTSARAPAPESPYLPTHGLIARGGKSELKRIRFTCSAG